jgi:hypothetical protein
MKPAAMNSDNAMIEVRQWIAHITADLRAQAGRIFMVASLSRSICVLATTAA